MNDRYNIEFAYRSNPHRRGYRTPQSTQCSIFEWCSF